MSDWSNFAAPQKIGSSDASARQCFLICDKSGLAPADASTV